MDLIIYSGSRGEAKGARLIQRYTKGELVEVAGEDLGTWLYTHRDQIHAYQNIYLGMTTGDGGNDRTAAAINDRFHHVKQKLVPFISYSGQEISDCLVQLHEQLGASMIPLVYPGDNVDSSKVRSWLDMIRKKRL